MIQVRRHNCQRGANGASWSLCICCHGRIHMAGCTSQRRAAIDCCEERHKAYAHTGQTVGLDDASLPMYDHNRPTWAP